jgi:putative phosphoribosyl transferase
MSGAQSAAMNSTLSTRLVSLDVGGIEVLGTLTTPVLARGIVVFVQETLASADLDLERAFERRGLATLLLDMSNVTDLGACAIVAIDWLRHDREIGGLARGLFGSGDGSVACAVAAAHRPNEVAAVVARDGRLDTLGHRLAHVHAPTLLLVGAVDPDGLVASRNALAWLRHGALSLVPAASHHFVEPGALDTVARLAGTWFLDHLGAHAGYAATSSL